MIHNILLDIFQDITNIIKLCTVVLSILIIAHISITIILKTNWILLDNHKN